MVLLLPLPSSLRFINGFILVIVANVPEGLPATVTSLLALTAMRLKVGGGDVAAWR